MNPKCTSIGLYSTTEFVTKPKLLKLIMAFRLTTYQLLSGDLAEDSTHYSRYVGHKLLVGVVFPGKEDPTEFYYQTSTMEAQYPYPGPYLLSQS